MSCDIFLQDFQPAGFEEKLKQQNYIKDGRVKFSSETETSQSEYESELDRSPVAQPSPPQITQRLKDFRLMEGSDATFCLQNLWKAKTKGLLKEFIMNVLIL